MKQLDTLARLTLDTLPINVAVLDAEGTILFTNRAWREFGGAGPTEADDMVGVNYFEATDTEADAHASEALAGLRAVVDGDRDRFTLEYPCHTEGERRWFLLRATALPDDDVGRVVVAHIDITERKLAELRAERQREELERLTGRLHGLVGDVLEAVLRARTREEIEATVCERLAAVEQYAGAWVGRADLRTDELVPAASAGFDRPAGASPSLSATDDPSVVAATDREPIVVGLEATDDPAGIHAAALPAGGEVVALPLVYGDTRYGVLTVYGREPEQFDERERAVLDVLARATSTAINAVEGRRLLTTDDVVELEVSITDEGPFYRDVAAAVDATLTYGGSVTDDDGVRMLFVVEDADPDALPAAAAELEGIEDVSVVSAGEDASVVEFLVAEPPVVDLLADHGGQTTAIEADPGGVRLTVELPAGTDARAVLDRLGERYPSVDLLARRERARAAETRAEFVADIEERLTARQRLALQKAYLGGFFAWPRETSGEDLAASMDISPSTYHQHLRTAERKVLASLFED
jgi:PAS domain S-box-containing protein